MQADWCHILRCANHLILLPIVSQLPCKSCWRVSAVVSWLSADTSVQHACFVVWTCMPEVLHLVIMGASQCCIQQPRHMLCRNMHEATTSLPIIGDGDTGYGNAVNVKRTVRGYAAAGFAGILIEDQVRCGG